MTRKRDPLGYFAGLLTRALGSDAGAGVLLILAAGAALALANSPWSGAYHDLFHHELFWAPVAKLGTWHAWINDGLMALFFFVVGLEIKREILIGELASPAQRRLPVIAAVAGMALPAAIYLLVTFDAPALHTGWAIPAATDIAFAIGVIGLLGKRVPPALRLFLLTVAIVDDLGAVMIIAVAYTASIELLWLGASAGLLVALVTLNRSGVTRAWPYIVLALALWFAVLHSGVHATIAGVLAALCIPLKLDRKGDSLLLRLEHALVPVSAYLVVPLFGFANAGVALTDLGPSGLLAPLPLAIALGLFLGKQLGVFGAIVAADWLGIARRPAGASTLQLWGMSLLCGIGFTMSLFIGGLAFSTAPNLAEVAKLGVLAGSLLSAVLGYAILRLAPQSPAAGR
jgi:NhaA family Na+:H+ antiporter